MPELKRMNVNGRVVLVEVEHDPGHVNPPLAQLNSATRAADEERRTERNEIVDRVVSAVRQIPGGRRQQKPLAPHHLPKAG